MQILKLKLKTVIYLNDNFILIIVKIYFYHDKLF